MLNNVLSKIVSFMR